MTTDLVPLVPLDQDIVYLFTVYSQCYPHNQWSIRFEPYTENLKFKWKVEMLDPLNNRQRFVIVETMSNGLKQLTEVMEQELDILQYKSDW